MLLGIPLALPEDLQAGAVRHDVKGPVMPCRPRPMFCKATAFSAQRAVIRHAEIQPEHTKSQRRVSRSNGRLAQELGVRLRFCRTHTPGRSVTYATGQQVDEMIRRLLPWAWEDLTFQLKDGDDIATVGAVKLDQIRGSLVIAREHHAAGNHAGACASISDMLFYDGGVGQEPVEFPSYQDMQV